MNMKDIMENKETCLLLFDEKFVTINCDSLVSKAVLNIYSVDSVDVVFHKAVGGSNYFKFEHKLKSGRYNISFETVNNKISKRVTI